MSENARAIDIRLITSFLYAVQMVRIWTRDYCDQGTLLARLDDPEKDYLQVVRLGTWFGAARHGRLPSLLSGRLLFELLVGSWICSHAAFWGPQKSPRREVVRLSTGAGAVYPPVLGHSHSIPQGMISHGNCEPPPFPEHHFLRVCVLEGGQNLAWPIAAACIHSEPGPIALFSSIWNP